MTPAAPIDLSRHLRREIIARGHLDLAVRIAVPILMVHFREKGARQAGVAIAVFHRGIEVERAADAPCGRLIAQAVKAVDGVEPKGYGSYERRGGNEWVGTWSAWWSPYQKK